MDLSHFHNLHAGETALLVGNAINLHYTPPRRFRYPSFGMNTIHKWIDWKPTYYVAADHRVYREFGKAIERKYRKIPKFIPYPNLDCWQGENFVRWYHRPGEMSLNNIGEGIAADNAMQITMLLAYYMGFTTILIIGMEHDPKKQKRHFWGEDDGIRNPAPLDLWFQGYRYLADGMAARGTKVINISEGTHVPNEVIPLGDWRHYVSKTY
jgi:hypothetical protein